jgi:hypothetical protein
MHANLLIPIRAVRAVSYRSIRTFRTYPCRSCRFVPFRAVSCVSTRYIATLRPKGLPKDRPFNSCTSTNSRTYRELAIHSGNCLLNNVRLVAFTH